MGNLDRRSAITLGFAAASGLAIPSPAIAVTYDPDFGDEIAPGIRQVHLGSAASKLSGYTRISLRDLVFQPGANTYDPSSPNDMISHITDGWLRVRQGETEWIATSVYGPWTSPKGIKTVHKNPNADVAVMRIIDLLNT